MFILNSTLNIIIQKENEQKEETREDILILLCALI